MVMILKSLTNFEKVAIIKRNKETHTARSRVSVYFHIFYVYSTLTMGKIYIHNVPIFAERDTINCGKGNIIWHFELN